ncbi:gephyrin-like molybdotransferase Glp [Chloroflexota bacterium]
MKPFGELLPFEQAIKVVDEHIVPITRTEVISIDEAVGRVLAEEIIASQNTPPFNRAAMDGYAVKAEDTSGAGQETPAVLEMFGELHAGDSPNIPVGKGQCIQIATGAMMPEGADAVVMVEDTGSNNGRIEIYREAEPLSNVGEKGSDIKAGETILSSGICLDAGKIGVLASQGIEQVTVYEKPRVAIMPSGEEVVELGKELKRGQLYDINSHTVLSVVKENGGIPVKFGIISDNLEDIRAKITEALKNSDFIVISGGSSVGERDLIAEVVGEWGDILFHGVKIRPGKPTMFALIEGKPVFGMPGYPTSSLINSYLFLVPALRKMACLPRKRVERVKATLSKSASGTRGREQFLTVKLEGDEAVPVFTESGAITSIARADGYIEIEADGYIEEGTPVNVTLF